METLLLIMFGPALLYLAAALLWACLDVILRLALSWWRSRLRRQLRDRNRFRAGAGGFLIALAAGLWARGVPTLLEPIGGYVIGGLSAFGLLWFCVGIHGRHGATVDLMALFWYAIGAIGCIAALVFGLSL